jgi:hypothetical protein
VEPCEVVLNFLGIARVLATFPDLIRRPLHSIRLDPNRVIAAAFVAERLSSSHCQCSLCSHIFYAHADWPVKHPLHRYSPRPVGFSRAFASATAARCSKSPSATFSCIGALCSVVADFRKISSHYLGYGDLQNFHYNLRLLSSIEVRRHVERCWNLELFVVPGSATVPSCWNPFGTQPQRISCIVPMVCRFIGGACDIVPCRPALTPRAKWCASLICQSSTFPSPPLLDQT